MRGESAFSGRRLATQRDVHPFEQHEIAARLFYPLWQQIVESGKASPEEFLKGMSLSRIELLSADTYVSWETFCRLLERCQHYLSEEQILEIGHRSPTAKFEFNRAFQAVFRRFADSRMIYRSLVRWYIPRYFRNLHADYEELSGGRLRIALEIDSDRHAIPKSFYLIWQGSLQTTPKLLGQTNAFIEGKMQSHRIEFVVTPPPSLNFGSRLRRAWHAIFSASAAVGELSRQQKQLVTHYEQALRSQNESIERRSRLELASRAANQAKMSGLIEMASGVSHEINNPLAVLRAQNDLLRMEARNGRLDPEKIIRRTEAAERMIIRIASIVSSLRSFARDPGSSPIETVSIAELVQGTLSLCRERFATEGIDLQTNEVPADLVIECRKPEIAQVLLNVLSNSFDALKELPCDVMRKVMIETRADADSVSIAVSDNGPGLSAEAVDKLFQPFFTTKKVGQGTGLGLSFAKGIVEAHGGHLTYEPADRFTRFVITLPKALPGRHHAA